MKRTLLGLGLAMLFACSPSEHPVVEAALEKDKPEIAMSPEEGLEAAAERGAKLAEETLAQDAAATGASSNAIVAPMD